MSLMLIELRLILQIAHKVSNSIAGTAGTASWLIKGLKKRAVVMWSLPYNFNHYRNWLGVGLTNYETEENEEHLFNQMYNKNNGNGLTFERGNYYDNTKTLSVNDGCIEITGIMGTSHKATVNIIVQNWSCD